MLPQALKFTNRLFWYPFHPRVTAVACKISWSFCQKSRWQVTANHTGTQYIWLPIKWHCKLVHGCMVCTEYAPRQQQFHLAPAIYQPHNTVTILWRILKMLCVKLQSLTQSCIWLRSAMGTELYWPKLIGQQRPACGLSSTTLGRNWIGQLDLPIKSTIKHNIKQKVL